MAASGLVDMLLVATPHPRHADAVRRGLAHGLHVLCEKPLCLDAATADELLARAAEAGLVLSSVFQTRFSRSLRRVKQLLDDGTLGRPHRCEIIETFWRPDAYYRADAWRGTRAGEGGGVLVNQAPHLIDRYIWLCGTPEVIAGHSHTACHEIEVEDTASILLRHGGGGHGYIHASTCEAPHLSRLEVAGDRGRLVLSDGELVVQRLDRGVHAAAADEPDPFGSLPHRIEREAFGVDFWGDDALHALYEDFAGAVWTGRPPAVSPREVAAGIRIMEASKPVEGMGTSTAVVAP